ncbi:unnamed protein product [Paramecium primaurelia]|uniref:Uncharacterized protein n=1 Tax=Paramecium primaurelia TaxID=5886 RepID=A0A8S1P7S7_PARPR|nr:unnamed protein product [Paramecium primaurelia]
MVPTQYSQYCCQKQIHFFKRIRTISRCCTNDLQKVSLILFHHWRRWLKCIEVIWWAESVNNSILSSPYPSLLARVKLIEVMDSYLDFIY